MDLRTEVTNAIIRLIEDGAAKGEGALWNNAAHFGMPINYKTKMPYSGVNVLLLWEAAASRGFSRNEWLTFNQAQELGANVKKGAKGVLCVFFKMMPRKNHDEQGESENGMFPMMKAFWLFNVADVENLPTEEIKEQSEFSPIERAEAVLNASGAKFTWSGTKAFYRPSTDEIYMPDRTRFEKPVNAYAVALHELTHWTGHKERLNRDFSGKFGDDAYAFEELVAELGSAFIVAHLGLEGARLENHANYIQSWLRVLKNDKNAIFTASRQSNAASQYILSKAGMLPTDEAC